MISFRLRVKMFTSLECSTTGLPIPTTQLKDLWWPIRKKSRGTLNSSARKFPVKISLGFSAIFEQNRKLAESSDTRVLTLKKHFVQNWAFSWATIFFAIEYIFPKLRFFLPKFSNLIFLNPKSCIFDRNQVIWPKSIFF